MLTREEIIKQVQKWAKDNDGKTPSEKNFYEYADVGIYNLHKLGWANYRELVLEAELTPNKFDKTKYSHGQLCKLFIEVIGEKSKLPTRGELDVKHHKNSNFPNSGTFYDKLGKVKNGDLVRTILEYAKDQKEYVDIIKICNTFLEKLENTTLEEPSPIGSIGYVYLLKSKLGSAVAYKIGKTNDPERRVMELNQPSNEQYLIWMIKTDDPT